MNSTDRDRPPGSLAILGAAPAFRETLHVGRPNIGDRSRLLARMGEILDRRWLSNNGPLVQEFERRVTELIGVRHCIAVCNATIALEIVARAAELKGEVIVPSYTFVATAHALRWLGITPVFADVEEATHNLDPARVEALITPRTTAILGTHVWGRPCAVEALTRIAERHGLKLMFDAAHAFACSLGGRMLGNFGLAEVYSFHATKFINAFEGGAVVTNDDAFAARVRLMTNFGFAGFDNVVCLGTNGKMHEASAAMALTSLDSLEAIVAVNRGHYATYRRGLSGLPGVSLLPYDERERGNYQYVVIELEEGAAGLTRDELLKVLHAENVLARRYFWPGCHRMAPYRDEAPEAADRLPATRRVADRVIVLPTGTAVTTEMVEIVCAIIRAGLGAAGEVRRRLATPA